MRTGWLTYNSVWQAFPVLLPVGLPWVMGDERTYERVAIRRHKRGRNDSRYDCHRICCLHLSRLYPKFGCK
jgi:GMP synthase PP-ATPase subunit